MGQENKKILGKGSILFHSRFEFANGELGEKLIIILNDPDPTKEPYLTARVTSQQKNRPKTFGCHSKSSLFSLPAGSDFFEKDTWIQLYEIFAFETSSLLKDFFDGALRRMGDLKPVTIQQLINCIRTIKDIERKYKKMILR